jgi:hypothetical protein
MKSLSNRIGSLEQFESRILISGGGAYDNMAGGESSRVISGPQVHLLSFATS